MKEIKIDCSNLAKYGFELADAKTLLNFKKELDDMVNQIKIQNPYKIIVSGLISTFLTTYLNKDGEGKFYADPEEIKLNDDYDPNIDNVQKIFFMGYIDNISVYRDTYSLDEYVKIYFRK